MKMLDQLILMGFTTKDGEYFDLYLPQSDVWVLLTLSEVKSVKDIINEIDRQLELHIDNIKWEYTLGEEV